MNSIEKYVYILCVQNAKKKRTKGVTNEFLCTIFSVRKNSHQIDYVYFVYFLFLFFFTYICLSHFYLDTKNENGKKKNDILTV